MQRNLIGLLLIGIVVVLSVGCAARYAAVPEAKTVENEYFKAEVVPISRSGGGPAHGYQGFLLSVQNKTPRNIHIDWNETLYINGAEPDGRFLSEGMLYLSRNHLQPPDIVFFNSTLEKAIWPNSLIHYSPYRPWGYAKMQSGTHGVYLSVKVDDRNIREQLLFSIREP